MKYGNQMHCEGFKQATASEKTAARKDAANGIANAKAKFDTGSGTANKWWRAMWVSLAAPARQYNLDPTIAAAGMLITACVATREEQRSSGRPHYRSTIPAARRLALAGTVATRHRRANERASHT